MAEVTAKNKSKIDYKRDEDYQAIINQSVAKGDYKSAAEAEMKRNAKIAGEALNEKQTFNYYKDGENAVDSAGEYYIPNIDYQALINEMVARGDMTAAAYAEKLRNAKIRAEGLNYDETNDYQTTGDPYANKKELFLKEQLKKKREAFEKKYASVLDESEKSKNAAAGNMAQAAQSFNEQAAATGLNSGAMSQKKDASGRVLQSYIDKQDKSAEDQLAALKKSYDEEVEALKKNITSAVKY